MIKYLPILLIALHFNVRGQIYESISTKNVKVDLANFTDDFPALLLSFEHRVSKSFYLHHEAGIILPIEYDKFGKISGFKLREEFRRYIGSEGPTDFYTSLDFRYTKESVENYVVLGYQCNNGCQFFTAEPAIFNKKLVAFGFRMGVRQNFYPMFLEYDMGYSYGKDYISMSEVKVPPDYQITSSKDPYNLWVTGTKALITFRAKLGLYLKKR